MSQRILSKKKYQKSAVIFEKSKNCDFSNFSQFVEKLLKLQKSQFLLDTLLPPVTLDVIN